MKTPIANFTPHSSHRPAQRGEVGSRSEPGEGRLTYLFPLLAALALSFSAPTAHAAAAKKAAATAKAATAKTALPAKPAEEGAAADQDQPKVKVERGAGGKKVYKIEGEIVIEGKIQKPEAFYVLQKSSINYDWHELKQEFVPKILDSVTKSPF